MTCALITGGRDFSDYAWGYDCLDAIHAEHRLRLLVIGLDPKKRKGVDWMGYEWAESRGVDTALFPPNWTGRGRPGGPYRNGLMVRFLVRIDGPKIAIVLPGQAGTANCAEQAHKAGILLVRRSPPASGMDAREGRNAQQSGAEHDSPSA